MQVADCSPAFAVITASPGATAVTLPVAASTFATSGAFVDHTTVSVESAGVTVATRLVSSCPVVRDISVLFKVSAVAGFGAAFTVMVDNVYSSTAMLSSS